MVNLRCSVARFKENVKIPRLTSSTGFTLQDAFFLGSDQQVNLQLQSTVAGPFYPDAMVADDFLLNNAAASLLGPPVIRSDRSFGVDHVGLIVADRYGGSDGALGVMFDHGFEPVFSETLRVPRRCCAIFVDAIADLRPTADKFEDECYYTAAHELGHVFNLQHTDTGFMRTSARCDVYPSKTFYFDTPEIFHMRRCDTDPIVCPGGSDFYGNLRTNAPANLPGGGAAEPPLYDPKKGLPRRAMPRDGLSLVVHAHPNTFFPFEPVELDITLSTTSAKPTKVPDQLHPGYARFAVFVTAPDGSRARYAPVVHHCEHGRVVTVKKDKPHTVDLTLFGQSGRYTFTQPGVHHVQALFRIPSGKVIASNIEPVEVRSVAASKATTAEETAQRVMTNPGVAKFLFYRSLGLFGTAAERLEAYVETHPQHPSVAASHYVMGTTLMRAATGRTKTVRTGLQKRARHHLERAVKSKRLKGYRCIKAENLLADPAPG